MEADLSFQQGPLIADIAVHVFSFLSVKDRQNVAKVCRYWRSTVYQASLWKKVNVVFPPRSSDTLIRSLKARRITSFAFLRSAEEEFSCLLTNITNVTHLHIKGCPQVSEECLKRSLTTLTNLEHLSFSRCRQLTDDVLTYYADVGSFNKLRCLTLEDCGNVTPVGFKALINKLNHLESLHLTWCKKLNDSCLETLSDSCPHLFCLRLSSCDWVSLDGLQHVTRKLKHIKNLDLQYSHGVDDDCVRLVANELNLQALDVFGVPSLTWQTIAFAASKLQGLRMLSFEGGELFASQHEQLKEMFDEISKLTELEYFASDLFAAKYDKDIELNFVSLLKKLPNLKQLNLGTIAETIGEDTAYTIANCMPELVSLTLSSSMIKDNSIITLCTSLKKLKTLELRSCGVSDDGIRAITTDRPCDLESLILSDLPEVTDEGLGYIARNLRSLNSLDVMDCQVTDVGLAFIAEGMPQLVSLNLSFCRKVSNQGAVTIGKHCKQLQHLILDYTQISDEGFVCLCKQLQHLRTLGVGHCQLTDKGFIDGAMFLKNLEELDVGSDAITDEGLGKAVKHLGGLTEMTLTLSPSVTEVGIQYLLTDLPNLNHLGIEHCLLSEATIRRLGKNAKATVCLYEK